MNTNPVDNRIGTGGIDILKDTETGLLAAVIPIGTQAIFIEDNDFPRLHIPQVVRADTVQRAGFRSNDIAIFNGADTKRPEPLWISRGNDLFGRHDNQRIGSFETVHRHGESFFDGL